MWSEVFLKKDTGAPRLFFLSGNIIVRVWVDFLKNKNKNMTPFQFWTIYNSFLSHHLLFVHNTSRKKKVKMLWEKMESLLIIKSFPGNTDGAVLLLRCISLHVAVLSLV